MFDIGWLELLLVFVVVLVVLGPTRLPEVARTFGLWTGRLRRMYNNFKLEIDREVGMDDIRQQLHNEKIMAEMRALEQETQSILHEVNTPPASHADQSSESNPPSSDSPNPSDTDDSDSSQARNG